MKRETHDGKNSPEFNVRLECLENAAIEMIRLPTRSVEGPVSKLKENVCEVIESSL